MNNENTTIKREDITNTGTQKDNDLSASSGGIANEPAHSEVLGKEAQGGGVGDKKTAQPQANRPNTTAYRFVDEGKKHIHELDIEGKGDYRPLYGTTTLINEVFPAPLAWYGSAKALERLGWITEKKEPNKERRLELLTKGHEELLRASEMNIEDYEKWLEENYRAHDEYKKSRGKAGTDAHALIETYIQTCLVSNDGKPLNEGVPEIAMFVKWAIADVEKFIACEKYVYSKSLWVGGKTDFIFQHKNSKILVGDNKPSIYPKHYIQTAGYGIQMKENGLFEADGTPIMKIEKIDGYCIFDYVKGEVKYRTDVERLESYFKLAVDLYEHRELIGDNQLN